MPRSPSPNASSSSSHRGLRAACAFAIVLVGSVRSQTSVAQTAPSTRLGLEDAVAFALAHHPSATTAHENERVAAASVDLARANELPSAALTTQLNRATGNVVPGSLFALSGIPTIAGPPTRRDLTSGAWGSEIGISAAWNVSDLLRRMTLVDATLADSRQAHAATDAHRLEIAYGAADAFVAVVDAHQALRVAHANVERARVFATSVHTLVDQQLRPGADAARADAEVAFALTDVARAEQLDALANVRLAEALGVPGQHIDIEAGGLLDGAPPPPSTSNRHPLLVSADAAVEAARLRQRAIDLEYLPRLDLVAALWLRGSGYFPGGANLGSAQGLLPDTPNWGVGLVLTWPIMDLFVTRARARIAEAQSALQNSRRREVEQSLVAQVEAARVILEGSQGIARNTEPALDAARAAEQQAIARYRAGLGTALDVADAQRVLARAEVEDVSARLAVRRSMLLVARATGDLTPFLVEARTRTRGGP